MGISFEIYNKKRVLCYTPDAGINDISCRLDQQKRVLVKHTFFVTKDLLREDIDEQDNWEEAVRFYDDLLFRLGNIIEALKLKGARNYDK